jgi:DNA repair protein RadC
LQEVPEKTKINDPKDAYNILHPLLGDLQMEEFWVIFVNHHNKILHKEKISQGGISGTVVDVRLIFKKAMEQFATGIFIAHNHPSGNLKPSQEDIKITKKIQEAGRIMEITLLDHLIITQNAFFSFANEGLL